MDPLKPRRPLRRTVASKQGSANPSTVSGRIDQPSTSWGRTQASSSTAAVRPSQSGVARTAESGIDLLRWLAAPQARPSRPGQHFLPCCPCHFELDDRACTPAWCFSYRYLDWLLSVSVILLASWLALLFSAGNDVVGPGSALFAIGVVVLVAYSVGWAAFYHFNLPPTVGMISVALVYRNVPLVWDSSEHLDPAVVAAARSLFFTISIVKAGLYFDGAVFRSYGLTIVLLGLLPCVVESLFVAALARLLFDLPKLWALTLGFAWGGASPVLLSLCLVSLANQGFGTKTGILSVLLAAGTVDNIVVIIIFDMLRESVTSDSEAGQVFIRIALKIIVSISLGCAIGLVLAFLPNRYSRHALLARFSLLILSCTLVHLACSLYRLDTAAYVCTVTAACFMVNCWRALGWSEDAAPLREVFEMLWHFCHPIMTVLIGMSCNFAAMNSRTVWKVFLAYFLGLMVRLPVTYVFSTFSRKPPKQRLFMALSYWSKGMLQTALGGLMLQSIHRDHVLKEIVGTSVSLVVIVGTYVVALTTKFLGPLLLPRSE